MTDEGDLKDYLGVRIERKGNKVVLTQPRMIQRILAMTGLPVNDTKAKVKTFDTPADSNKILQRDSNGKPRKHAWNYRAAVGALSYLQSMSRPDLTYCTHQAARFSNEQKLSHEEHVKRIVRYLWLTKDKGLEFEPDVSKGFECHVDADWAGNWHKDFSDDPSTALSRTGFVISYAGCPIIWKSCMQGLVALSTCESEYIALSTALREVIALMNLLKELKSHNIPVPFSTPKVKCRVFEDNAGCIELATNHKARPRTKHLSVRLHHFRDHVKRGDIVIEHVSTTMQVADIMTKPLARDPFRKLRKMLMGW